MVCLDQVGHKFLKELFGQKWLDCFGELQKSFSLLEQLLYLAYDYFETCITF